jgi:D-tyrosyl-tRNA(Tyr) deacylase
MRVVLQRVSDARVDIDGRLHSNIGYGMLIFLGIEPTDTSEDADWLAGKVARMRIYPDVDGVMNRNIQEAGGAFLVISQFTLHASTKKGNRPSYIKAAKPDIAVPLYEYFLEKLWMESNRPVKAGVFGADMKVSLINDGPVTITMDSKRKE